jgi:choline kinase
MRYLILAAGVGRRMGGAHGDIPKCLIDINGEPLIVRLLRQIRRCDRSAEVDIVVGYKSELIEPLVQGCRIVVNPFFDIAGINASLWLARAAFDEPLMLIHGDVVLSEDLADELFAARSESLVAYDSSVLDPQEINIAVADGRVTRFGVNFPNYSGAYACVLKLSAYAAKLFAETLNRRVRRGSNEARTYYFFVMRRLVADPELILAPFDFARHRWKEIDYFEDVAIARARVGGHSRVDAVSL